MVHIAQDVTWLVGRTPLLELRRFAQGKPGRLLAKLEGQNPGCSNKDRAVLGMLCDAERSGALAPGATILECSAGDMSLSLAVIAAARGYRVILVMPEVVAPERRELLRTLGAEVVTTPAALGMRGALQRLEDLSRELPTAHVLQPFTNRANARAHEETAREVWADTDGLVDAVVVPIGTGGTAAGCVSYFRGVPKPVAVFGVEPDGCAVLAGQRPGAHALPGLGVGFVPEILPADALAGVAVVAAADARSAMQRAASAEGLLIGLAGGAVLHAALGLLDRTLSGKTVVAIVPDRVAATTPGAPR